MFNNQILDLNGLKLVLTQQKSQIKQSFKDKKAIVEADKETPYSKIQPVMALMSELEIESIQLAVATEEKL
jgi:biopolymer transport protein ExbD